MANPIVWFFTLLIIVSPALFPRKVFAKDTYVAPQAELFVRHSKNFRSHFIASGNYLSANSKFTSAWGQYDVDFGLAPFFRRYVFKDPNIEKAQRLTCRLGYLFVSDLKSAPNGFDEQRPFGEILFRIPIGRATLIEDRNREEYRIFDNEEYWRYRNRLRVERNMVMKRIRMTPYTTGEFFYDHKEKDWNEIQVAVGVDFPLPAQTLFELECMAQLVDGHYSALSFGLVLQKHL